MRTIAYLYRDPLLDPLVSAMDWGRDVDQVYQDLQGRHSLQQLLEDCATEPTAYLLVRRLEELGDSVTEVSDRLNQLQNLGVQLIAIAADLPFTSDQPLQASDLLHLFQTLQTQHRSRRIRQGHARNRIKALPPPGKAPFGYRRGKDRYALDRSTAPIVKDFFEHFLLYGCLRSAVRYLEKKHGKKISASTGQRWLTHPVYRGDLAYENGEVIANTHVAIVSREEAAQVDRILRRNRRLPPRTASAPRSLAGLVRCGTCQSPMTVTRVTKPRSTEEYLYLRPISCPQKPKCKAIPYAQILEQTIQAICQELPQAVAGVNLPDLDRIKAALTTAIATQSHILNQLPDLVEQGILDAETAEWRAYKLRAELSDLQGQLAQLPPVNLSAIAQTVSLPQFWFDLSEAERRFYFREFIRQVQLVRQAQDWQVQLVFIFEFADRPEAGSGAESGRR